MASAPSLSRGSVVGAVPPDHSRSACHVLAVFVIWHRVIQAGLDGGGYISLHVLPRLERGLYVPLCFNAANDHVIWGSYPSTKWRGCHVLQDGLRAASRWIGVGDSAWF